MHNATTALGQPTASIFADNALALFARGLCPIPCGGPEGKQPLVKWGKWHTRPGRAVLERQISRPEFKAANVGILTGLSGVTIVDCDAPGLIDRVLLHLGETPLITRTPSGGHHAWYRSAGETSSDLRRFGLAVDIKGHGGLSIEPPSLRRGGQHAGSAYSFHRGGWDELDRLPPIRNGGLGDLASTGKQPAVNRHAKGTPNRRPKGTPPTRGTAPWSSVPEP